MPGIDPPEPSGGSALEDAAGLVARASGLLHPGAVSLPAALASAREELAELEAELARLPPEPVRVEEELGDALFALAALGAAVRISPERALRGTLRRLGQRMSHARTRLVASGRDLPDATPGELAGLWDEAKARGRQLFLATPLTALSAGEQAGEARRLGRLAEAARVGFGADRVYCAALQGPAASPAEARRLLFAEIEASSAMVLLWPRLTATSALIEVGYALGSGLVVHCLHHLGAELPYLLREDSPAVRRQPYLDDPDLERRLLEGPGAFQVRP